MTFESIGPALAMASLAAAGAARCNARGSVIAGIAAIAFGGALVPLSGVSVAGYALAFPGVLSAATLVLASQLGLWALGFYAWSRPSLAFLACVAAGGLVLYPAATGVVAFDVYDLGFRGVAVPVLMAAFVVAGWLSGARDVAVWVGGAALLYVAGAFSSDNLWDYLLDPLGFLAAVVLLAVRAFTRGRPENRANSSTTRL